MVKFVTKLERSSLGSESSGTPSDYKCSGYEYKHKETPSLHPDIHGLFFEVGSPDLPLTIVCQVLHGGSSTACVSFLSPPSMPKT